MSTTFKIGDTIRVKGSKSGESRKIVEEADGVFQAEDAAGDRIGIHSSVLDQWELVEAGEGQSATAAPPPETTGETPMRPPLIIHVPKSAVDHFWEEPPTGSEEFWAFKEKPDVDVGQRIEFRIAGDVVAEATVGRVEEPGESKCDGTGRFKNHWKVYWPPESFKDLRPGAAPKKEEPAGSPYAGVTFDQLKKHHAAIRAKERIVSKAHLDWEMAKDHAAFLKKEHERHGTELCRMISEFDTPAPLFDSIAASVSADVTVSQTLGQTDPAASDDAWKSLPLSSLKLSEKIVALLTENGVTTFGQLEDLRASRWENPKIKGLGEKKQQEIEDAVVGYWTEHPQEKPAAEAAEQAQPAADASEEVQPPTEPAPIADHPGVPVVGNHGLRWAVRLAVHPRIDSTWALTWECKLADVSNETPLEGSYPDEHAATAAGIAAITAWVDEKLPSLDAKGTKAAQAVKAELAKVGQLTGQEVAA